MIAMRLVKRSMLGIAVALMAVLAGAAPAVAGSPWWHLDSGSRPSDIAPGSAKDEVLEVTVSATGGFFQLQEVEESGNENETKIAGLPFDATAAEVQEGVERDVYSGGREVRVAEGSGDTAETHSWVVTLPDQSARPMLALSGGLSGAAAQASVKELSHGRPDGQIIVSASNIGDASVSGAGVVRMRDALPAGLRAVAVEATAPNAEGSLFFPQLFECSYKSVSCAASVIVAPYKVMEARVSVVAEPGTDGVNEVSISGGGVPGASVRRPVKVSSEPASFGVEDYELNPEEVGGEADTQAGSHPFQLTTTLTLNQTAAATPVALGKDLNFKLPPGLIGNPIPFPQCTLGQFLTEPPGGGGLVQNECQPQTAVGVAVVYLNVPVFAGKTSLLQFAVPLFNLEPSVGEPARFGFMVEHTPVYLDTSVRTGGDYGVTVSVDNISQQVGFLSNQVTFWGVPGDPRHDSVRGWGCLTDAQFAANILPCANSDAIHPPPLLAVPTSCTGPMPTSVEADSWAQEGVFGSFASVEPIPALDGCNRLPFSPTIAVTPDGQAGSTPTGLTVGVHVPQDVSLNAEGLAEADVKDTMVTLPAGVALNPAAADGLFACGEAEVALAADSVPSCPEASKVATVQIKSPLLANPLEGEVYLAAQDANPFGSLVALYLVAEDPVSGVLVKLAGEVKPDPVTGQLVATFKDTPQLPFEDLKLHFFGGDRAPLGTPAACGGYTTTASISPWSGNPPAESSSEFQIVSGPNGSPCHSPLQFSPSLTAGMTSIQAGGFSPFTMTMSREDGQQNLRSVQLHMPPGLSGTLASVKLCGEEQANAGTCGPESQIGETTVSVGLGGDPYTVTGGKVYITGPYRGAPYGLSIVNPAKAGPYDLGKVIVRAKIEVDENTAALTITTDTEGPYKIPTILDGIPLQIKHVNVTVNRPGFTFNPTNCSPLAVTGTVSSAEGSSQALSVPFQVTNCAVLAFRPKLTASTSGRTSRAAGASLSVKLSYPAGPYDANIARVKVELPKQLPSQLKTLQKACTAQVFEANPANCPAASIIGHATATTPVLPVPLTGPAYFVSHGGEAFPSLIIVLQGYGVTVHLVGSTFISKAGITSSTFKTVPDVPVGTFELTLPQGPYSALTANANLCKAKLAMPTEFVGQNGALIETSTKIAVGGCPKAKQATRKKHAKKAAHAKGGRGKEGKANGNGNAKGRTRGTRDTGKRR
jgi:hypothetical protein